MRKNSTTNNANPNMRPRANTLSHVDAATLGMLANTNNHYGRQFASGHGHHNSVSGYTSSNGYGYRGMPNSFHTSSMGLPKLDTAGLPMEFSGGLRTAPPFGGFNLEMGLDQGQGNTINPHALHMNGMQGLGIEHGGSPFQQLMYSNPLPQPSSEDDGTFDWMTQGFENHMNFHQPNENAIDDSSPSAMSTNSPANMQEINGDMQHGSMHSHAIANGAIWQHPQSNVHQMVTSPSNMDFATHFNDMITAANGTISPKSLLAQHGPSFDLGIPTPPDLGAGEHGGMSLGMGYGNFQFPLGRDSHTSSASTSSMDSSLHQSSITTVSSDLVSDSVRSALLAGLQQNSPFGQRKYSQPLISSPLSDSGSRSKGLNLTTFPSTQNLQRYVSGYLKYFHPHLPFLHIPSLNFEATEYSMPGKAASGQPSFGTPAVAGGGSCLMLSIAAIGAVYESEMNESKDLFDCAKRLISSFLEERRKANLNRTQYAPRHSTEYEDTPLWLVQAMLLNVIYGHNCGDKTAAELASNHCAALVSLARGAELARPYQGYNNSRQSGFNAQAQSSQMGGDANGWQSMINENEEMDWSEWKVMEERKRTLYAVFILSSMLVTAYNHAPALTNSEIRLDLPCDEELWAADSSQTWQALGGVRQADSKSVTFAAALTHLLMSSQRQEQSRRRSSQSQSGVESELRPSTFGCLILVNALHNYIWETRQRHLGRQWTMQETEQMHAHIEPALRAWQTAWASNPSHSLERPNPFGAGPLSADSIPLLDLAYVRLYINLGRSKEAFWQRDYDGMAEELAKGREESQGQKASSETQRRRMSVCQIDGQEEAEEADNTMMQSSSADHVHSISSRRERQLRRAAFYAADSLLVSEKLGLGFNEHTGKELPSQSAMCAFDCAQVLAEWVSTLQERVGKYLGVIGRDDMDLMQVPGILLLEDDDRHLLGKIEEFLTGIEQRVSSDADMQALRDGGYGSRILMLAALLLDRAAVWPGKLDLLYDDETRPLIVLPVTKLMGRSLNTQAAHMKQRALDSTSTV